MRWVVIHNIRAGKRSRTRASLARVLEDCGIDAEVHETTSAEQCAEVIASAHSVGTEHYVAAGGDGTLHGVVNALMAHEWPEPPTVGILPLGSGSDFARSFALPRRLDRAIAHLKGDSRYLCDIGLLEGSFGLRYFVNVADVGVAGAAVSWSNRLPRKLGKLRYTVGFWLALAVFSPRDVRAVTSSTTIEASAVNVVIANGQFFGGGMHIAPQAVLMDGLLDVEVFTGRRWQALSVMPRVMRGTHLRHASVRVTRSARIEIECRKHWPIEADGELIGRGSVVASVVPGAFYLKI